LRNEGAYSRIDAYVFGRATRLVECKDQGVAADLWRFAAVKTSPFETQFIEAKRPDAIELALDRLCVHSGHGARRPVM